MSRSVDPNRGVHINEVRRPRWTENMLRHAQEATERAISLEGQRPKYYGGHLHTGARSPLLTIPVKSPILWRIQ